jgi:hypothetical protein
LPFRRQATTAPGTTCQRITVLGCDFTGLLGAGLGFTAGKHVTGFKLILIYKGANLRNRFADFFLAHLRNLILQCFDLVQKIFQ